MTDAQPRFARLLVTGGAGFIGSCFVRDVLARKDGTLVTVIDKLTLLMNRVRQASITREIIEVVSGAAAT